MPKTVTQADIDKAKGETIRHFCENTFVEVKDQNHCAHWVSHMFGLHFGATLCGEMGSKKVDAGVSIRCDDVYNGLTDKGPWSADKEKNGILIFAISPLFMHNNNMQATRHKHVGILWNKLVYNYHNVPEIDKGQVVTDPSVDAFIDRLRGVYHDKTVSAYYAVPA